MCSARSPDSPCLVTAVLLAVLLAGPVLRAQDEGDGAAPAGENIIPWDLPEDSDGVLEPNEMDVRGLAQLLDSLCAPPPPLEPLHVGTFDAATGAFIWGPDCYLVPSHELLETPLADVGSIFDDVGIEELNVDLDPAITGVGSLGNVDLANVGSAASQAGKSAAAAAPKPKPASGKAGKSGGGKASGAPDDDRLRGHLGDKGVVHAACSAAKLDLVFDVVNRPAGHAPFAVSVDGVTVQALGDSLDLIVPPRTHHAFSVSCGKVADFADEIRITRPPLMGAFTLEALPVALVYEPPGGSGCSQTWTQSHRVGTQIRSFQSDDSAASQPVDTPFSRVNDYISMLSGAGAAAANSNVPYVAQAGAAASTAAAAMETAWGHSTTTQTISHSVNESHVLSFALSESTSVSTSAGLGPGKGDLYYLLIKPTFAWLVAEDKPSGRLFVTVALLGYQGHATVSATDLRSHVLALPPADVQDQLLALDPLAAEYVAPAGGKLPGLKPGSPFAHGTVGGPAPPRLLPLASPLVIVSGGNNSFSVDRTIESSDLVETTDIRTTTTDEEAGLLSYVSRDVPQDGSRTLRVLGGRSTLSTVSDEVSVSVTLSSAPGEPLYLEAFYDRLFGTFAFKPWQPGEESMSGTVADGAGLPKPAQDVSVKLPDGTSMKLQTDKQGHFEVHPPAGLKGALWVESGGARTRVDWKGETVKDVLVRGEGPHALAKAGGKKSKGSGKLPDPGTVPVTASEGTTAGAIRGKPAPDKGKADAGPATLVPDPTMKGRLGRIVISFAGEADVKNCSLAVTAAGPPEKSVVSRYGTLSEELLPAAYVVSISGRRVPGIEVRSGHETRVHVGVLRVEIGKDTSVELYEPGAKESFLSFYGSHDVLLPPGRIEVSVGGMRDTVDVREGEITPF